MMPTRQFSLRPESEFLVWCARTVVTNEVEERIRRRAQGPLDWALVVDLAWYHGVGSLLYRSLSALCSDLVPLEFLTRLRRRTQAVALLNRLLAQEIIVLCEAMAARGVPVIPIKGATLAASVYGDLTLRDFNDMDLLVPEHAIADAKTIGAVIIAVDEVAGKTSGDMVVVAGYRVAAEECIRAVSVSIDPIAREVTEHLIVVPGDAISGNIANDAVGPSVYEVAGPIAEYVIETRIVGITISGEITDNIIAYNVIARAVPRHVTDNVVTDEIVAVEVP